MERYFGAFGEGEMLAGAPDDQLLLEIAHKALELEAKIKDLRFYRRLWLFVLALMALLLAGLGVLGNILIDISGLARVGFSIVAVVIPILFLLISIGAVLWLREEINDKQLGLSKLRETRKTRFVQHNSDGVGVYKRYQEEVVAVIDDYRQRANRYRRTHNLFQAVVIIGSIATTSATSAIGEASWIRWAAVAISVSVGISAGFTGYYKFRERAVNLQRTADDIEAEYNAIQLRIFEYREHLEADTAFRIFAERVERLKEEQHKREQQLEQPPDHQIRSNA